MVAIKSTKPEKELNIFMWASIICFGIAFLLPFVAIGAFLLAFRALLLSFHKVVRNKYYIPRVRVVTLIVLVGSVALVFAQ